MIEFRAVIASFLLLTLSASTAAAEWYGSVGIGQSDADTVGLTLDERSEPTMGLGVGVVYNKWFATQLDWQYLGANSIHPACLPPALCVLYAYPEHGLSLRALPRLPLGDSFALELGLGLMKWDGGVNSAGTEFKVSGTAPLWSIGFEWQFAARWAVTAEYLDLQLDGAEFSTTGATLRYRF